MKKTVLSTGIMAILFVGCSVDAEELLKDRLAEPEVTTSSVCFSCADQLGFKLEICSNMDGTYTLLYKDVSALPILLGWMVARMSAFAPVKLRRDST